MSAPSPGDPDATRTHAGGELLAPGATVADRYRIEALVGVGGMGMVYRAHDHRLDLPVALKLLRPEIAAGDQAERRFVRELVLARQVSHPNVVRIHDLGEDGALRFLTMDFVDGRSLQEVLREDGALPPERAVEIACEITEGLGAAHREGVVHRDLKPANVLLADDGRAFVTDFGVARSLTGSGLTRSGGILGTLSYLSPEQARGETVDGRSDLYALGLLLYEMLTGELPFRGETANELLAERLTGEPRTIRDAGVSVPAALETIVARCLAVDPDDRYPDAAALAEDLRAVASGDRLALPFGRRRRAGARRGPRKRTVLVAVVAAAAALLAVAALLRWPLPFGDRAAPAQVPAAGAPPPLHAVAVLPLADETGRPELAWAPGGLAELLSSALAESPELRVVEGVRVATAAEDLAIPAGAPSEMEVRQLAELLDVDRLVVGALHAEGERLRVDARLLAPEDGPRAAGQPVSAAVAGAAELSTLVETLANELRSRLEAPAVAAAAGISSASPEALAAYSRGVQALARGDSVTAAPALEEAVAADPTFGAAWLRLATAHRLLGYDDRALEAAERAARELPSADGRLALEARALAASLAGEPERSRAILAELAERYPHDSAARLALAESYGDEGLFPEAREILDALVAREPHHPRAWFLLGKFAILAGDSRRAADDYLVRALVVQNRLDSAKGRADVLNAMGIAHRDLGEIDRALERYEEAAALRREIGDRRGYAATLTNLGNLLFARGDFAAGRERLEEAIAILRELGSRSMIADLENELGLLEEERGRYQDALQHFRSGLQMRQELGDRRALAESLNNVGFAYYLLGDLDNAGVYWQRAHDLYEETGNREGVVIATQSLGLLDLARGEWPSAVERFAASLETSRGLRIRQAEAVARGHLGRVAQLQGRYGDAFAAYDEALAIVTELEDPRGLAEFTLFTASALAELGSLDAAASRLDEAEGWVDEAPNREHEAELARLRGEVALGRGSAGEARLHFRAALESAEGSGGFLAEMAARRGLARTELARGDRAGAAAAARELAELVEAARRTGFATVFLEASVDLAAAHLRAGDPAAAEAVARDALRATAGRDGYAGAWRLHLALAEAHEARGQATDAARSWAMARGEIERVQEGVTGAARQAFTDLPEVQRVVERAAAG